ncbi:PREDICTED: uncharacterized protein LOC106749399 [Dinoponera quadriceps]|uniref:Uncharacterized protein LOC106749399 n=1 Tax=Dinoponera quadriceps TaxID=609295 RepID=A0A6P3Y253_DINQU|nr:PREDICTED: uncharacterized protein LOC106749399 [Dinoponera quadriceps]
MRTCTLVFVALAAVLLCAEYVSAMELCPQENCLTPDRCEEHVKSLNVQCLEQGTTCCSIVKKEYQTHCRHFGGVCMNRCAPVLQQNAVDCEGQVCCVLV